MDIRPSCLSRWGILLGGDILLYTPPPPSFCIGGGLCFVSGDRGGPSSCTRGYFSQLYLTLCTCPWHREPHAGLQGAAGSLSLRGTRLSLGAAVELDILMHYMDGWRKSFLLLLMLQSALAQINPSLDSQWGWQNVLYCSVRLGLLSFSLHTLVCGSVQNSKYWARFS